VAQERVRDEFLKLLLARGAARGLTLLSTTGLLTAAFPELDAAVRAGVGATVAAAPARAEVRLAVLLETTVEREAVLRRLRLPAKTVEEIRALLSHPVPSNAAGWTDSDVRRWASALGRERVEDALALAAAKGLPTAQKVRERVQELLARSPPLPVRELALDGRGVMEALGVGPSPVVGEATRFLLEEVLTAPERNTEEALRQALRDWSTARGLKPGGSA